MLLTFLVLSATIQLHTAQCSSWISRSNYLSSDCLRESKQVSLSVSFSPGLSSLFDLFRALLASPQPIPGVSVFFVFVVRPVQDSLAVSSTDSWCFWFVTVIVFLLSPSPLPKRASTTSFYLSSIHSLLFKIEDPLLSSKGWLHVVVSMRVGGLRCSHVCSPVPLRTYIRTWPWHCVSALRCRDKNVWVRWYMEIMEDLCSMCPPRKVNNWSSRGSYH